VGQKISAYFLKVSVLVMDLSEFTNLHNRNASMYSPDIHCNVMGILKRF